MNRKYVIWLGVIILLAAFLRLYRVQDLMIFRSDQAIDAQAVMNLLQGHFSLLGPRASVGDFYNGPIVYYLMAPFFAVFGSNPLSGTLFQIFFSIATTPLLYWLGKKLRNETVGLTAAFLFAISPLHIDYSRAIFNSYPAVFFSTLSLCLLLLIRERMQSKSVWLLQVLLGIILGLTLQMHYLTIVLLILSLLVPLVWHRSLLAISYYARVLFGFVVGLSPFLLFELRHNFLNTIAVLRYFVGAHESKRNLINSFEIWPRLTAEIFFARHFWLGLVGLTAIIGILFVYRKTSINPTLKLFLWLCSLVFLIALLYGSHLETHYVISLHTVLILLCALGIYEVAKANKFVIIGICSVLFIFNLTSWHLTEARHPLQDGISSREFEKAAAVIAADIKTDNYNVGMDAQQDNRAMPLRYFLHQVNKPPRGFDQYSGAQTLYFIFPTDKDLRKVTIWEYTSFGRAKRTKSWLVNDYFRLYRFEK